MKHWGSILAAHPGAPDLILGIPQNLFWSCWDSLTMLVRGKWTEAWKFWSSLSSTGKCKASTTKQHLMHHPQVRAKVIAIDRLCSSASLDSCPEVLEQLQGLISAVTSDDWDRPSDRRWILKLLPKVLSSNPGKLKLWTRCWRSQSYAYFCLPNSISCQTLFQGITSPK